MSLLILLALFPVLLVNAQVAATAPAKADPLGRNTPYGCVVGFLKAAAARDYAKATQYLDLRGSRVSNEDLVRRLNSALNRGVSADLSEISREPEGQGADGLVRTRERIGFVDTASGRAAIELSRVEHKGEPVIWLFSADTLRNIPAVPDSSASPLTRYLPSWLVDIEILSVPLWRFLAGILSIVVGLGLSSLITRALVALLRPVLQRATGHEDVRRFLNLRKPIGLLVLSALVRIVAGVSVSLLARKLLKDTSFVLAVGGAVWLVTQTNSVGVELRIARLEAVHQTGKVAILSLGRRLLNVFFVFVGIALLLGRAGVNLTAVLTGLGVGGVALALAAQKTLENLFGGISLIMRDIVRPGDTCIMAGETGIVQDIGLGSTLMRTMDRTMVSVPNAELSQKNLENISRRDKFWLHQIFGLRYDTSPQQMRTILADIEGTLRNESSVERVTSRVRFIGFGESSLTLEIFAYVLVPDNDAFLVVQQKLLLAILEVISSAGVSIASRAIVADWKLPPAPGQTPNDLKTLPEPPRLTSG
jgi:MscS family membrane protein